MRQKKFLTKLQISLASLQDVVILPFFVRRVPLHLPALYPRSTKSHRMIIVSDKIIKYDSDVCTWTKKTHAWPFPGQVAL